MGGKPCRWNQHLLFCISCRRREMGTPHHPHTNLEAIAFFGTAPAVTSSMTSKWILLSRETLPELTLPLTQLDPSPTFPTPGPRKGPWAGRCLMSHEASNSCWTRLLLTTIARPTMNLWQNASSLWAKMLRLAAAETGPMRQLSTTA